MIGINKEKKKRKRIKVKKESILGINKNNSLEEATKRMAVEEVNKRWQDYMAPFFETDGEHADKSFQVLKNVFYLA